ncbi:hypothetical protein AB0M44_40965 [Streptosporangium subroseum]|uniref:diaminopimelate decarboxylase family protein n=1 Tax=Streptosporangium subroseum TaxID=106412 RepID=UPI0034392F00
MSLLNGIDLADVVPACVPLGPDGVTAVEEVALRDLTERFGTPLWVISRAQLEANFRELSEAFARHHERFEIAYSMKANNNRVVIRVLTGSGALIDCSSEHELALAVMAGVTADRIIVNGNGKSPAYLDAAVRHGVRQVNVDSMAEAERLSRIAVEHGVRVRCVVRLKLNYARLLAKDPAYERTLRVAEAKFGSSVESGEALRLVARLRDDPLLDYVGVSHHAGFAGYRADYTAERQLMHIEECTRALCEFARDAKAELGVETHRVDVGGGLRSGHNMLLSTPGASTDAALHPLPSADQYAAAVAAGVAAAELRDPAPVVQMETGGFQVGNAVLLLAGVLDVKDVEHLSRRRFVTLDAAMTMFVTRGLTRVGFPAAVVGRGPDEPVTDIPVELVGPTCAYDSIAEDIGLPDVFPGDLVVLLNQGAYCEVMSTQFNALPRPAVVLIEGSSASLVRRRETLADIVARETSAFDPLAAADGDRALPTRVRRA